MRPLQPYHLMPPRDVTIAGTPVTKLDTLLYLTGFFELVSVGVRFCVWWVIIVGAIGITGIYGDLEGTRYELGKTVAWWIAPFLAVFPTILAPFINQMIQSNTAIEQWAINRTLKQLQREGLELRLPSSRELDKITGTLTAILEQGPKRREGHKILKPTDKPLPLPRYFFIIDRVTVQHAFAIGEAIFMTKPLLDSGYFAPILAHQYGHIVTGDSLYVRLLRFLPVSLWYELSGYSWKSTRFFLPSIVHGSGWGCLTTSGLGIGAAVLAGAGGGWSLWLLRSQWAQWWRGREFVADAWAVACGQGGNLKAYLESRQYLQTPSDIAIPFGAADMPTNEERIDYIDQLLEVQDQPYDDSPYGNSPYTFYM